MTEHKKIVLTPRDYDVPGYREMIAEIWARQWDVNAQLVNPLL